MTYCLAIATNAGLVFCSDSRTNAGPDMLSRFSKMHIFKPDDNKVFCLLTAGNLATTQAIVNQIEWDLKQTNAVSLQSCANMNEAVRYVANINRNEQQMAQQSAGASGIDTSASLILGGQIRGSEPELYLIYSVGNFISASKQSPYLQIGESKYGKPILDRIVTRMISLEDAVRCAIVSMDSTLKSNATVGPPIELLIYQADSFSADHHINLEEDDTYLHAVKARWDEALKTSFESLPPFEWGMRNVSSATSPSQEPVQGQPIQSQAIPNQSAPSQPLESANPTPVTEALGAAPASKS